MRIVLTAVGTAGDVFPFIGLGVSLKEVGHEVLLVSHSPFAERALRAGLGFAPIGTEREYLGAVQGNPKIWDPEVGYAEVARCALAIVPEMYGVLLENIGIPDTVIVAHYLDFASPLIQAKFGAPVITAVPSPSGLQFGEKYLADIALPESLELLRSEVGSGWNLSRLMTLGLYPQWFGAAGPPPPRPIMFAGFPLYDNVGEIPPQVDKVLSDDLPVVVVAAGSRAVSDAFDTQPYIDAVGDACSKLSVTGLLLGLSESDRFRGHPSLVAAAFAPLSRVLPRAQAIVHHGGVGTIAAAMACGIPQLSIPLCHDQPENTQLMMELGLGASLPYRDYDATNLAEQLQWLTDSPEVRARCHEVKSLCNGMNAVRSLSAAIDFVGRSTPYRDHLELGQDTAFKIPAVGGCNCDGACGAGWG